MQTTAQPCTMNRVYEVSLFFGLTVIPLAHTVVVSSFYRVSFLMQCLLFMLTHIMLQVSRKKIPTKKI